MKKHYLTIVLALIGLSATAQHWSPETGVNYVYTSPLGSMRHTIKQGNGIVLDFAMITPSKRFAIGAELQYTIYGYDNSLQQYDMGDGTTPLMEVTVNNSFVNFMAVGRYYLITEGNFQPYLAAKGGYSHYSTDLNIYDPDEWDNCSPVESEILQEDGTFIASFTGGIKTDLSSVFKRMPSGWFYVDFNASITQGGTVKYMNTDAPTQHSHHTTVDSDAVTAEFVNTQTQAVHSHHVGTLYSSPVQLLDFKLGVSFRFNR